LKEARLGAALRSFGNLFQVAGPAYEMARSLRNAEASRTTDTLLTNVNHHIGQNTAQYTTQLCSNGLTALTYRAEVTVNGNCCARQSETKQFTNISELTAVVNGNH